MRLIPLLAGLVLAIAGHPAIAQSTYGDDFFRAEGWSGEYPDGFTVLKNTTVMLRPALSPTAEKTIDCPLPAKATYHPWNTGRALADNLQFVSFTEIDDMEVVTAIDSLVYGDIDNSEVTLSLKPGDHWRYLTYYAEGTYLMEHDGTRYVANQDLMEAWKSVKPNAGRYEEWLRIDCSNNKWGWLFMPDVVADEQSFAGPTIGEYGTASDAE